MIYNKNNVVVVDFFINFFSFCFLGLVKPKRKKITEMKGKIYLTREKVPIVSFLNRKKKKGKSLRSKATPQNKIHEAD